MKKRMYLFIALFMGAHGLYAQDCATGFCPPSITVHHKAGDVSPTGTDITYKVVGLPAGSPTTCWITSNLGSSIEPGSQGSYSAAIFGWSFQSCLKQGWLPAVTLPTSWTVATGSSWTAAQDPCTLLLGSAWHIPTNAEWALTGSTLAASYASIKLNFGGWYDTAGSQGSWGVYGTWCINEPTSNSVSSRIWAINNGGAVGINSNPGNFGTPARCVRNK